MSMIGADGPEELRQENDKYSNTVRQQRQRIVEDILKSLSIFSKNYKKSEISILTMATKTNNN